MPQNNPGSKPPRRLHLKLPAPKQVKVKSLFEEYPYVFFALFFAFVTILAKAAGMSFRDALILGGWLFSIVFFAWQVVRYKREKSAPSASKRHEFSKKPAVAKNSRTVQKRPAAPAKEPSTLTVSDSLPPRWPPPFPRLVAPLSVTLAKKEQDTKKPDEKQSKKATADENSKP
jgi:hypothetical protein